MNFVVKTQKLAMSHADQNELSLRMKAFAKIKMRSMSLAKMGLTKMGLTEMKPTSK